MSVYEQQKQFVQFNQVITLPDANAVLYVADSGKTILLSPNAAVGTKTITLPIGVAGLTYRFIMSALVGPLNTHIIAITGGATSMEGIVLQSSGSNSTVDGGSTSVLFVGGLVGVGAGPGACITVTCLSATKWSILGCGIGTTAFGVA